MWKMVARSGQPVKKRWLGIAGEVLPMSSLLFVRDRPGAPAIALGYTGSDQQKRALAIQKDHSRSLQPDLFAQ